MTAPALFDEAAEVALLGAIVIRPACMDELADVLEPDDFGRSHHRLTFAAMRSISQAGQPIDPLTLAAELERGGVLEQVGRPFLFTLGDGVPHSSNVLAYAKLIRDKATVRRLQGSARQILASAEDASQSVPALLEEAEALIYRLTQTAVKTDWIVGKDLAAELYPVVEGLTNDGKAVTGVSTGFSELDWMTRGFQAGDLILLGARPSQGKTALALQIAMSVAKSVPVGFFSVEMARQPLGLRGVIASAQVDGWRLLSGRLSDLDLRRVSDGLVALEDAAIYIDESPLLSPVHVRSKLRRLKSRAGSLGLVVIDYLQLMAPSPEHRHENKTNQVAGISRALKIMAREFGVPFLVLSQLSRHVERAAEKRPTMSDLRDSGALEQDADVVLLLHRPEVYDDKPELAGVAEVVIGKQRNGPTGIVELKWHGPHMRFETRRSA